ncbi:pyridine nucleotide-disulfide oxidoreductase [Clavibacter michiganensis]|uniref:NAD(P)-binding domain-containing protein n=1 Tax=Clavibacter michiganensis TaxID=28447 RepID=UPI000CE937B0|nr:NAD(P)-binding domain-containing protein [Clavibacter michiganensis]PPF52825.1 pyridine nucleotide-disulfide oxidoreductase [Clavibacter michiganensis]
MSDPGAGPFPRAAVTVIGGGQAGLSAAHHLRLRGFASALEDPGARRSFAVVDANPRPGGAWQHRWESLRMATVNGIFGLPGMPVPPVDPTEPSRTAVPRYFADYEREEGLPLLRPVRVLSVAPVDADPRGDLRVTSTAGSWRTAAVVNATGTWDAPVIPDIPGRDGFLGVQLHTRDYVDARAFAGMRVAVVGGGISAVQLLEEISRVTDTLWYTRREPVFLDHEFSPGEDGVDVERRVAADAAAGRPPRSVVSYTGLGWTGYARAARDRGVLVRRPLFRAVGARHVVEADGSSTSVDAILWATGFRASLAHLEGLDLRGPLGGIPLVGTRAAREPRVHLVGYGPSQSTVGANRAGRAAVRELARDLADPAGAPVPVRA